MTYVLGLSTHDIGAIRGFYEAFTECLLARDFERILTLYSDDAIVMPPNHAEISGHVAIREWMESFPKVTRGEYFVDEIEGGSDLAYVRGRYAMMLRMGNDQASIEDRGKYIEVRRRQPDGSWRLWRDIFNSDLAPADT